jgi:hypothetical protein
MSNRLLGVAGMMLIAGALCAADNKGVRITELDNKLRVEINDELFTEGRATCIFLPAHWPGQEGHDPEFSHERSGG